MFFNIPDDYKELLGEKFFESEDYKNLEHNIMCEYLCKSYRVLPDYNNLFRAFELTPVDNVKVVIVVHDPYPSIKSMPDGLSFSSNTNGKENRPGSLEKIFEVMEINESAKTNKLDTWAKNGVLLLNSHLTVIEGFSGSHASQGWEILTDEIIKQLSNQKRHIVFILLGEYAKKKDKIIDKDNNHIICASHPSPRSHGSFNNMNVFEEANKVLGENAIDWKKNIV